MRRIVLFGMPGSGKSTQGHKLSEYLSCPWISTGEILRNSKEPWVQEKLKTAELFDDQVIIQVMRNALSGTGDAIIDGFPRNAAQAKMAVEELGISEVIELTVTDDEALTRMTERGRDQDETEVAKERINIYKKMRSDVAQELWRHGIEIKRVDGMGTIDEVFQRLKGVV